MIVERHASFIKSYKTRISSQPKLVKRVRERLLQFAQNPQNLFLKDHPLKGNQLGLRAFSITGDIRIIYKRVDNTMIRLVDIGSHNQIYK
ncbi:type II toxin-antitoxin system mRNA interferase toxin, RelE/StbE family [Candidatus Gottesmanbacteria bacterium]|nr:type II toxin-antitoxin system mRNA interferase toxin, RelE/StbE family [Candidatus Gottesmanbacteria bacterium]